MLPVVTKPLVLIVDDNRDTREMYALYLPMIGYSVETAAEGREAVIKALTLYPDVIVMDLQMPGVDGWRAMREICGNARTAGTPVIVLTGHDFKDYLGHSAIAEGAFSYLHGLLTVNTMLEDAAEGIQAFLQKRKPVWKGK